MGLSIDRIFPTVKAPVAQAASASTEAVSTSATAEVTATDSLQITAAPRKVTVPAKGHLAFTAQSGDTYWGYAKRFAATTNGSGVPSTKEIQAYVKDLQALNGTMLKAGQTVKLPLGPNASYKLPALVAAQKDVEARAKAGEKLPEIDWAKADARWGYAESMEVTLPLKLGGEAEVLAVREYGPARGGSTYQVSTTQAAVPTPAVPSPRQVVVPAKGHLAITVQKGEGVGAIARRFAASQNAPEAPSPQEVEAYSRDIIKANGGKSALKVGQALKLPLTPNAGPLLSAIVAAQVDWKARGGQGTLNWGKATAAWGYAESISVTVPGQAGTKPEKLAVREYGAAKGGTTFEVDLQADFDRRNEL